MVSDVLITGASGFVGRHVEKRLCELQYDVIAVDSSSGDVAEWGTWTRYPRADVVIHLAGRTYVPDSWNNPEEFFRTNLFGTICALRYCRQHRSNLIFASTYVYGVPGSLPISENATLRPSNPYAMSKKIAEDACRFYSEGYGLNVTILRPFNVYGPGQDCRFLIPSTIAQVRSGKCIEVEDLEPKRDYLYIDDLVSAFLAAIQRPARFDIFNVASGTSHSVSEIIQLIQEIAGTSLPIHCRGRRRQGEIMETVADIRRARDVLGWEPSRSLRDGCSRVMKNGGGGG